MSSAKAIVLLPSDSGIHGARMIKGTRASSSAKCIIFKTNSSFLIHNFSLLIRKSSFYIHNSSFLLTPVCALRPIAMLPELSASSF